VARGWCGVRPDEAGRLSLHSCGGSTEKQKIGKAEDQKSRRSEKQKIRKAEDQKSGFLTRLRRVRNDIPEISCPGAVKNKIPRSCLVLLLLLLLVVDSRARVGGAGLDD
jgi:hypothetical protein